MSVVYYITDRHSSPFPILRQIQLAIEASVDLIQIRENDLPQHELLGLARKIQALAKGSRSKILVNDRLDIAMAAQLDGIHLGRHSVLPAAIRERIPQKDFLIGASIHSMEEFRFVEDQGVSFVTLSPIFFTPSKAAYGKPIGLDTLRNVCRQSKIPVLALGGITQANYLTCLESGAAGVAAIRLFQCSEPDLSRSVREIHGSS